MGINPEEPRFAEFALKTNSEKRMKVGLTVSVTDWFSSCKVIFLTKI